MLSAPSRVRIRVSVSVFSTSIRIGNEHQLVRVDTRIGDEELQQIGHLFRGRRDSSRAGMSLR